MMCRRLTLWLASASCILVPAGNAALAQDDQLDTVSTPVVQRITPAAGTRELNGALSRLAANPGDVDALIDAGNAAALLGDFETAMGFFGRANQIQPGNGRAKAGLATALLRNENPYDALRYFDEAVRAGVVESAIAADRGLAYDMVGENARAQRDYQIAMARAPSDEVIRRYALSLAIAGNRRDADAQLLPLLRRQDSAAWRTRAFIYAIAGDEDEAISIAYATMPRDMAENMAPYLRYMTRLTKAQKAAAANFGHFPRAAQIGRDDPRVSRWASADGTAPSPAAGGGGADSGLVPAGEALGTRTAARDRPTFARGAPRANRDPRRRPGGGAAAAGTGAAVASAAPAAATAAAATAPAARPAPIVRTLPVPAPVSAPSAELPPISAVAVQTVQAPPPVVAPAASTTVVSPATTTASAGPGFDTLASAPVAANGVNPSPFGTAATSADSASVAIASPPPFGTPPAPTNPAPFGSPAATVAVTQPIAAPSPAPAPASAPAPATAVVSAPPTGTVVSSNFDLARLNPAPVGEGASPAAPVVITPPPVEVTSPTPAPVAVAAAVPPAATPAATAPAARPSLDSLFSDYRAPEDEAQTRIAAVDVTRITPTRPRPPAPAAAPTPAAGSAATRNRTGTANAVQTRQGQQATTTAPAGRAAGRASAAPATAHPSRVWVQLATSPDRNLMGSEWRRLGRLADEALRGKRGYVTPWRSNFRLLTGPFETERAAQQFLNELGREDVQGFVWTSAVGQVIDGLPASGR